MEPIICSCRQEITLSAIATCLQCRQQAFTTLELKVKQRDLDKQARALMVESSRITTELYLRSFRRPELSQRIPTESWYFKVRGVPRGEKVGKAELNQEALKAEAKRLLELI